VGIGQFGYAPDGVRRLFRTPSADELAERHIVAIYQRHWHERSDANYLTAAIVRPPEGGFIVIGVDNRFAYSVSEHETLEAARTQVIEWVGEAREVTARRDLVPQSVWLRLRTVILTGDPEVDPPLM
jgi:hypothetical protein